jgi:predicted molibdopterin-dependent oxidoreductase YjgC
VRFVRVAETARPAIAIEVDGMRVPALAGDTILTALRLAGLGVRTSEFGDGPRGGFCLMGACQECFVAVAGQGRVRACQTPVAQDMRVARDG